jgi:hypothetical protein
MFGLKQQDPHADLGYRKGGLRAGGCSSHARPSYRSNASQSAASRIVSPSASAEGWELRPLGRSARRRGPCFYSRQPDAYPLSRRGFRSAEKEMLLNDHDQQ